MLGLFYGLKPAAPPIFTTAPFLVSQRLRQRLFWNGFWSAILAACAFSWAGGAWAQSPTAYPSRAVKWIVPFAAGGSGDTIARLLAERMTHALGQPVLIDNRGGNGSVLGTEIAAKAAADGHTWVLSNGAAITTGPLMGYLINSAAKAGHAFAIRLTCRDAHEHRGRLQSLPIY